MIVSPKILFYIKMLFLVSIIILQHKKKVTTSYIFICKKKKFSIKYSLFSCLPKINFRIKFNSIGAFDIFVFPLMV